MARDGERRNRRGELVGFHETTRLAGGGIHQLTVRVGKRLEITAAEASELAELALCMRSSSRGLGGGWLEEYVRAHTSASKVLRGIISRAHT